MRAQRIILNGTSGAGKTTLGRELARRLDAPFVELDAINHRANWVAATTAELQAGVAAVIADHDRWVIDGNYDQKLGDSLLARCQLVVWLDLPLALKLGRVARRSWRRIRTREALWNGNRESWRGTLWGADSLFVWLVRSHFRHRRQWPARLANVPTVRLRSPAEVERWLATF